MIKKFVTNIIKYVLLFVGLIVFYIVFLMAGHAIPRGLIIDNVQQSYIQLQEIGLYFEGVDGAEWDNWTDSYFINSAVTEYDGNLLQKAVANAYTTMSEIDESGATTVVDDIKYAIEKDSSAIVKPYSRYWVGMLTIYKVLLIFMPLNGIRTLIFGIVIILFATSAINIYQIVGKKGLIPYLISVVIALYIPQSMCLVFSTDVIMMLLMMNICCMMLKRRTSTVAFYKLFFLMSSLLAYLNYWAFPLITLGFPLILYVTTRTIEKHDCKLLRKETFCISLCWGAGLGITVLVKQILCKIVLGTQTGTDQLLLRMGSEFTLTDRLISVVNGIVRRMESAPVLILTLVVTVWAILLIKTNRYKKTYQCYLLILIALYPIIWWFILANHCIHGFVKHMYGITYYGLLSSVLINCDKYIPFFKSFGKITKKKICINISAIGIWLLLSCALINTTIHYGTTKVEPWSLETMDTINLGERTATQYVHFMDFKIGTAYLKNISTILVNLTDENKNGTLHVEILQDDHVVDTADVPIADISMGEWFDIPIGCMVDMYHEYKVTYSVENANGAEPYLLVQDDAQAVKVNDSLYVEGENRTGAIANRYEYDDYIISLKAKIVILSIILLFMQYGIFIFEDKKCNPESNR